MTTKLRTASFQNDAVTAAKIAANAVGSSELDLTANYTFTGTISGTSPFVKLGHQNISADTTEVVFDNIITSDYGQVFATGEVVTTSGTDCHMHIHYRSGGAIGSDISSNMSYSQGDWANRAAAGAYQGNVIASGNAFLKLGSASTIKGGSSIGFEVSWRSLHTGFTTQATNATAREVRHGNFAWAFQATNASDNHGGNGWFRADSNPSTHTVTGLRFVLSSGNMHDGKISVYGKKVT